MVFGLFSKERALKRAMEKTTNKLAQSPDRYAAMERLRDEGTEEALFALCKRFSITSMKLIEDQEEKSWVVQTLVAQGAVALAPLRRYMKSATSVAYPLRVLEQIAGHDQALEIVDEVLADEPPGYTRDPDKRIQIIGWLDEWEVIEGEEVVERVAPYLADFDENVRFAAAEALAHHATPKAAPPLVAALVREEEESHRLRVRIAEILADKSLSVGDQKDRVARLVADSLTGFKLQGDKLVQVKG